MSDPRASITRTVLAPPTPTAATPITSSAAIVAEEMRLIGKQHGRMRCVNLSLTVDAKTTLYERAAADGVTLGEALMDLVARADVPARQRRPNRSAAMRRGLQTVSVSVLLTPGEARVIVSKAEASGRSVSDYATCAVTR